MIKWRAGSEPQEPKEASRPSGDPIELIAEPKLTVESDGNHVYYYADVDSDRGLALIKKLRDIDTILRIERISRNIEHLPPIPIYLHINSYGGSLFDGLALADSIPQFQTPIYSVIEGCACSAATLISMACTRRFIHKSGFMLIHQFSTAAWGTYEQIKDEMVLNDKLIGRMRSFYSERSKLTEDEVSEMLKHDTWLSADECLEKGFVDEIL